MKKDNFIEIVEAVKLLKGDLCVEVHIPGNMFREKIINCNCDLNNKLKYYLETYDTNMVHKHNNRIFIESAYIIK